MARTSATVWRNLTAIVLVFMLGACTQGEHRSVELQLSNGEPALPALNCKLRFNGLVDSRASSHLSQTTLNRYEIVNLMDYLDTQIHQMLCCDDTVEKPEARIELRHAYSRMMRDRGFYTVVLILHIEEDTAILRGRRDYSSWDGAGREYVRGLKGASDASLALLHETLRESGHCQVD
ncbi:MAG: hypothetical protein ACXIUL_08460 [Wenzhouxiangella sp.]